jgi:hypothetical protein
MAFSLNKTNIYTEKINEKTACRIAKGSQEKLHLGN